MTNYQKFCELEAAYNSQQGDDPGEESGGNQGEGEGGVPAAPSNGGCSGFVSGDMGVIGGTMILLAAALLVAARKKGGSTKK